MIVARRVYQYGIAFATVWMLVNGLAGLLGVALDVIFEVAVESFTGPVIVSGRADFANRVSFYGALTGIGLVTWIIHWGLVARSVRRDEVGERRSAIRKLYLYGSLLVGGVVLLFQVGGLIASLFGLLFGTVTRISVMQGELSPTLAMTVAAGVFWTYHLRVAQRDRQVVPENGAAATIRRWCVYILALIGLMMLLFATAGLIARLLDLAVPPAGQEISAVRWLGIDMAARLAAILTGLIVWLGAWSVSLRLFAKTDDPDPERDSTLRKVYLYLVLFVVVSWAVWNASQMLYVLVRSALIPSEAGALWSAVQRDLGDKLAKVVVFGIGWAYHARVIGREAAAAERQRQSTIRWIYGYLVALVGAVTFSIGVSQALATALDVLVQPGVQVGAHWWEERLSLAVTLIVVGLPVWLIPWTRLQREVVASVARRSLARRIYLFLALGITVLTLLGSGAFALYQVLRVALGERWTASNTSDLLEAASAAIVAGLLLAYHLRVFQRDAALAREDVAAAPESPAVSAPVSDGLVTLLVVRAGGPDDARQLRERIAAALPAGASVETVRVEVGEAERLLRGAVD